MKRVCSVVLLMISIGSVGYGQRNNRRTRSRTARVSVSAAERSLRELNRQWSEAAKNRDKIALERLLDDQFMSTANGGQVSNKRQWIDSMMGPVKVESYSLDDVTVRVFGDTGVVIGRWIGKFTVEGKTMGGTYRFTETYIRIAGAWKAVAAQQTRIGAASETA